MAPVLEARNADHLTINSLSNNRVASSIRNCYPSFHRVVRKSCGDRSSRPSGPALSATLENLKVVTGTDLSTSFYGAELDHLGVHMLYKKGDHDEEVNKPIGGKHHLRGSLPKRKVRMHQHEAVMQRSECNFPFRGSHF